MLRWLHFPSLYLARGYWSQSKKAESPFAINSSTLLNLPSNYSVSPIRKPPPLTTPLRSDGHPLPSAPLRSPPLPSAPLPSPRYPRGPRSPPLSMRMLFNDIDHPQAEQSKRSTPDHQTPAPSCSAAASPPPYLAQLRVTPKVRSNKKSECPAAVQAV